MADCPNVEIRELLPERAGGALSAADLARVDGHLASCERCASELALIQAARRTLRFAPAIDVGRIASGVVTATLAPARPQLVSSARAPVPGRQPARLRWIGWKAAAAIAVAAAGVGSFAVWHSVDDATVRPNVGLVAAARPSGPSSPSVPAVAPTAAAPASPPAAPALVASAAAPPAAGPAELGVGGGLNELSSGDLQALLGDLATPGNVAADASFEEPDVIVPEVGSVNGWESL